jgi:hypothetical protein
MRREIASHTARTMATCLVWIEEFEAEVSSWSNPIKSIKWDIRREGRRWSNEEFDQRLYRAPEKIEFVNGIFASEQERFNVLGMLLENLGIDKVVRFGRLADWKAATADVEKKQGSENQT